VAVVLGALVIHVGITLASILRFYVGVRPLDFYRRARAALVTAFSTSSSSATLPTAIDTGITQHGFPRELAGFVFPMGSTMCMNGTSLFEGVTVIFLAQVFGVSLSLGQMVAVMVMSVITAIGAAGVPGGSIPLLVGVMAMFRVPPEGIAVILGIDRILDMSRTTVNVCGDFVAAAVVGRSEKVWDASMLPAQR
jgi:DAACS family dicarboxylate/amino acid:cation (Na+ or H+) symporter